MVTNSLLVWVKDRVTGTCFWSVTGAALVLAVSALLLGYNLTGWLKVTWYDEGITLQVARNLAESAKCRIASSDGFEPTGRSSQRARRLVRLSLWSSPYSGRV